MNFVVFILFSFHVAEFDVVTLNILINTVNEFFLILLKVEKKNFLQTIFSILVEFILSFFKS